ncbi:insulinase family protein [Candidatus Peregrinibacteria bacterium]|nr:MAG: insulinase family protein [Candidatus Peregrinibacteria bacterium]
MLKQKSNGLKIITTPIKSTQAVTVLVLVGAGSRYETKSINGISHYLEHLFFKGASRYKNAAEVSFAIDSVGGDFNAFTGKEYAGYYVKLSADKKEIAFDVIGDMMLNATFLPEEIDKERNVIIEEFNMYQDTPMYQVGWDFERLLFGDQPMGWDQIGIPDIIRSLNRDQFLDYKRKLYTPDNTVISVAGNITEEEVEALVEKYFPFQNETCGVTPTPYQPIPSKRRVILQHKKTEQAHLILGTEGIPANHPDEYVAKVLSVILGGNMSSRMFLNVRESKGLSYYIRTQTDDYSDVGTLATSAGVDLKRVDLAVEAILEEYYKIAQERVSEAELQKAKDFMKGKMVLKLEDSEEYAHLMGKQALLYPEVKPIEELFKKVDAVTVEDIQRVSQQLFQQDRFHLALIGPFEDEAHFEELLKK